MQSLQTPKLKLRGYLLLNLRNLFWVDTMDNLVSPRCVTSRRSDSLH